MDKRTALERRERMDECIFELKALCQKHKFKISLERTVRGPKESRLVLAEHTVLPIDAVLCVSDRGTTSLFEDDFVSIRGGNGSEGKNNIDG